jgi:ribosomal protein S19
MSRSKWKGPFFNFNLKKKKFKKKIYVWSRSSVVPRCFFGSKVWVHNGRNFKTIFISKEKIGFKFGSFCLTRTGRPKTIRKRKLKKK